jgi:hypothetical protein
VNNVAGPNGTVTFSAPVEHFTIGNGWGTWSNGYTGDVYYTNGATSVVLTMPTGIQAFYLYAEPTDFGSFTITATAQDGTTSTPVSASGNGGATFFGFSGSGGATIASITVSTADPSGFAIGEFGSCAVPPPPPPPTVTALSSAHIFVGLANSDDQGTQFDVMAELLKNGTPVASGIARCVVGATRNPLLPIAVPIPWTTFSSVPLKSGDVLAIRLSARIGTNPDNSKCLPAFSHDNATALRVYYDSLPRQSNFGLTITPPGTPTTEYLHSDGTACGDAQSAGVSARTVSASAPALAAAKCTDSTPVNFAGGNPWQPVGVWSLAPQP